MRKLYKVLIILFAIISAALLACSCVYRFYAKNKIETVLETARVVLTDENLEKEIQQFVDEMLEKGEINIAELDGYVSYKNAIEEKKAIEKGNADVTAQSDTTTVESENTQTTVNNKTEKDGTKKQQASEKNKKDSEKKNSEKKASEKKNSDKKNSEKKETKKNASKSDTKKTSDGKKESGSKTQKMTDDVYYYDDNVSERQWQGPELPEGYYPEEEPEEEEPADSSDDTLFGRIQKNMSAEEFAFAMSVYSRLDVGYVMSNINTNKSEVKKYVQSVLSSGEISRCLELYGKYSYLLR